MTGHHFKRLQFASKLNLSTQLFFIQGG